MTVTDTPPGVHYCPHCGAVNSLDAHFCEHCGLQLDDEPETATRSGRGPWTWVALGAALLALAGAGTAIALLVFGGDDEKTEPAPAAATSAFKDRVTRAIEPVGDANEDLSRALERLRPGDRVSAAQEEARSAARISARAQRSIARLSPASADERRIEGLASGALADQVTYVTAIRLALSTASAERLATARIASDGARGAWLRLARDIPGAGGLISGIGSLSTWARAKREERAEERAEQRRREREADRAATPAPAPAPAPNQGQPVLVACGGFEGITDLVVSGVDCTAGFQVASNFVNGAGGTQGFSCSGGVPDNQGLTVVTCNSDTGFIEFGVFL